MGFPPGTRLQSAGKMQRRRGPRTGPREPVFCEIDAVRTSLEPWACAGSTTGACSATAIREQRDPCRFVRRATRRSLVENVLKKPRNR